MKNSPFNLRRKFSLITTASAIALCLADNVDAQTLVPPSTSDITWYTASSLDLGNFETAMIAYGSSNTIYAIVDHGGNIHVNDDAVGNTTLTSTNVIGSVTGLDMVIGNWDGVSTGCTSCISPSTDFIMAIAHRDNSMSGNIQIDYYDIYDDGISTVSVNPLPSLTSTIASNAGSSIHLDLIAEASNTCITGRPFCNKFVLTWNANNFIYGVSSNLNNPALFPTVVTLVSPQPGETNVMPDVSYVQQSGFSSPRTVHDIAIIPYIFGVPPSTPELKLLQWDVTTNSIVSNVTIDNSPVNYTPPRIDALDDHTLNGNPSNSNYKVISTAMSFTTQLRTYDNVMPTYFAPSNFVDISTEPGYGLYTPPYINGVVGSTSVALNGNYDYQVVYSLAYDAMSPPPAPNNRVLIMTPINWTAPTAFSGGNYYWANSNGSPTTNYICDIGFYITSVSTPVNDLGLGNLTAWVSKNLTGYQIDYKITNSSYNYRPAGATVTNVPVTQGYWNIDPNPTTNHLSLQAAKEINGSYQVIDMLGRALLQGNCKGKNADIDVNSLAPGSYLFKVHTNEGDTQKKFIKN